MMPSGERPFFISGPNRGELFKEERKVIQKRRKVAFGTASEADPSLPTEPPTTNSPPDTRLPSDLVGLALSGGGLRSAAYNLGFIQALSRSGLFRYVDYLSSVSGGGYVAGHVATAATRCEEGSCFHDTDEARFGVDRNERLEPERYRFRHLGEYLLSYASFLWRYVVSTLASLSLFVGVLGALGVLLALIWRSHDLPIVIEYRAVTGIDEMAGWFGINGETLSAFLPSVGLFVIFLLLAIVRHGLFSRSPWRWLKNSDSKDPRFPEDPYRHLLTHATYLIIGCIMLGICLPGLMLEWLAGSENRLLIVGLLGFAAYAVGRVLPTLLRLFDGDAVHGALWVWVISLGVSVAVFLGNGESPIGPGGKARHLQSHWTWVFFTSAILSLLPLLASGQLARSAQNDAPYWKQWIFRVVIISATVCAPLFLVHWMARENISGYATHRNSRLLADDILDWDSFLALTKPWGTPLLRIPGSHAYAVAGWDRNEHVKSHHDVSKSETEYAKSATAITGEDSWNRYRNSPLVNPIRGTWHYVAIHRLGSEQSAFNHLKQWKELQVARQNLLDATLNKHLDAEVGDGNEQRLTAQLMRLVLLQVAKSVDEKKAGAIGSLTMPRPPLADRRELARYPDTRDAVDQYIDRQSKLVFDHQPAEQRLFVDLWNRATLGNLHIDSDIAGSYDGESITTEERADFNRLLLQFLYPDTIRSRRMISTRIVPVKDQQARLGWLAFWATVCGVGLALNYNHFSPFYTYYRERLSQHFVLVFGDKPDCPSLPLAEVATWNQGGPYPLLVASQFYFCRIPSGLSKPATCWTDDGTLIADSSRIQPWIFAPLYTGGYSAGFQRTDDYCRGELNLEDAMAMSGAALTPLMVNNLLFSGLMAALNLRIGQWLPRPKEKANSKPTCLTARGYQIADEVRRSTIDPKNYEKDWQLALVADGGFHDFFGIEELLIRRCRVIIISDAGCNNGRFEFGALAAVIRMVRERHGIHIVDLDNERPVDLSLLKRDPKENRQPLHHICFRILYPEQAETDAGVSGIREGLLIYSQMSLTGREQLDLQQFRNSHPNFPDEPITNQFFDPTQVESYRQLGYEVGLVLTRQLGPLGRDRTDIDLLTHGLVRGYLAERCCYASQQAGRAEGDASADRLPIHVTPMHESVAEYASRRISAFLSSRQSTGDAFPVEEAATPPSAMADAVARCSLELLALHREKTGLPLPSPFKPGGRRELMSAAAVVANYDLIPRGNQVEQFRAAFMQPREMAEAFFDFAHSVFASGGVETTAEFILRRQLAAVADGPQVAPGTRWQPAVEHHYERIVDALRRRSRTQLQTLLYRQLQFS